MNARSQIVDWTKTRIILTHGIDSELLKLWRKINFRKKKWTSDITLLIVIL